MKTFAKYIKHAILGTLIASKAGASVVSAVPQAQAPEDNWQNLRRHLETMSTPNGAFDFQLPDPASTPEALPLVYDSIRESYLATERSEWVKLDSFWTDHPKVKTSPVVFQEFLAARSSLRTHMQGTREEVLQNWLHNAHHKPGHYDNGGGNGDNDCTKKNCGN